MASRLTDELMGAAGLFGPDGRDVVIMLDLDDAACNRWKATGFYTVRRQVRIKRATGIKRTRALAALLQQFRQRHFGRRWRLVGDQMMAGVVVPPKPRVKREEE